jgi:uncharacterized protein YecT (DUF1311 family)
MPRIFLTAIILCTFFAIASGQENAKASTQSAQGTDPCANAITQQDMNQCAAAEYQKADAHLNRIYAKLIKSFKGSEANPSLRTIEKVWIKYRDLHCEDVRLQYEGGSIAPLEFANCMTIVTNHRIEEIKSAYDSGDVSLE